MYESLKRHCKDFHLYIFAFNEKCYDTLKKLNLEHVTVISLSEFEDEELQRVKKRRSKGEYCWTCSSSSALYVMENYDVDSCTYLDSDIYFFGDPAVLLEELKDNSVIITDHRYSPEYDQSKISGKYCVQFVTFKNDERGLEVLRWWSDECINWCYNRIEDGKFGDQKYLDVWPEKFEGVHVLEHLGGGVAPWNVQKYKVYNENNSLKVKELSSGNSDEIIFYHFHDIRINSNNNLVRKNYYKINSSVRDAIYKPYARDLREISIKLNKLDNSFSIIKNIKLPLCENIFSSALSKLITNILGVKK